MSGEPTVLLRLGPDFPSRVAFILGVPTATGFTVLMGFLLPAWILPILVVLWIFVLWYLTATATVAYTEVSSAGLTFVTALRECSVPWRDVRGARRQGGRLNLHIADGGRIAISQYSLNPLNVWLKRPRRQVADAGRLQAAVEEARQLPESEIGELPGAAPSPYVRWRISVPGKRRHAEH